MLRSPVCGLTLADLHALAGDGRTLDAPDTLERLSGAARTRAGHVFAALDDAQTRWRKRPLRDLVEGLWQRLGGTHTLCRPATDLRDAMRYLDTLAGAETGGRLTDWNAFIELLGDQFTEGDPPADDIRVEILTMHGAKGLEWDLVVLPGLDRGTGGNDRELLYWLPFTPASGDEQVLIAPLRSAEQADNSALIKLIREEQKTRETYEHQRLLYVAATRAREHLVLSASLDPDRDEIRPPAGSLLADLWPTCGADFSQALEQTPDEEPVPSQVALPDQDLRRIRTGWQPPQAQAITWQPALPPREREIDIEFNWAGMQARRIGTVLHRLLERVGNTGIEQFDSARRRHLIGRIPLLLQAMGGGHQDLDETVGVIRAALENTLDSDIGRWILSGRHRQAACELPVSGLLDGRLVNAVIDRTFIDADSVRWIIDYKSGYHAGGDLERFLDEETDRYQEQLTTYHKLFEQMGEINIKTALYLPRHGKLREV